MDKNINFSINNLKKWIDTNGLVENSKKTCLIYLKNYLNFDKEHFEKTFPKVKDFKKIKTELHKIQVCLNNSDYESDFMYILIFIKIEYSGEEVGYYKIVFDLDGNGIDDFIVKPNEISQNY